MDTFPCTDGRTQLARQVKRAFLSAGWQVAPKATDRTDFEVSSHNIKLVVVCLEKTIRQFRSDSSIVGTLENLSRANYVNHNVLIAVLDRNFLSIPLAPLRHRHILAVTAADLDEITSLSTISACAPSQLSERQASILTRNLAYTVFVSREFRLSKEFSKAIEWARYGVESSVEFSTAHMALFNALRDSGDLSAAASFGAEIIKLVGNDMRILRPMRDLAQLSGNHADVQRFNLLLSETSTSLTLDDILRRQHSPGVSQKPNMSSVRRSPTRLRLSNQLGETISRARKRLASLLRS